jgi:hypothetical protein
MKTTWKMPKFRARAGFSLVNQNPRLMQLLIKVSEYMVFEMPWTSQP